jgi:hypothetical protein
MTVSSISRSCRYLTALCAVAAAAGIAGCSSVRPYSSAENRASAFVYPPVYDTIIEPLRSALVPVYKRIFFLKNDIKELKDRLWDGGTDQRIMRINDNIDVIREEVYALSDVRKEILNAIYFIYPPYVDPKVVPYLGRKTPKKKGNRPMILVSLEDQRAYQDAKMCEEKMSEELSCGPLIASAIKKFESLPDSLKKPVEPIGTPGPVPRIRPYTPPPLYRGE